MTTLLIGICMLGALVGLFYLKDRLKSRALARIAYSGLTARIAVIAVAMIAIGILIALDKLFS